MLKLKWASSRDKATANAAAEQSTDAASQKLRSSSVEKLNSFISRSSKPKHAKSSTNLGSNPEGSSPQQPPPATHGHSLCSAHPPELPPTLGDSRDSNAYHSFPPFQDFRRRSLAESLFQTSFSKVLTEKSSSGALTNKASRGSLTSTKSRGSRKSRRTSEIPPITPGPLGDDRPVTPYTGPYAEIQTDPHNVPQRPSPATDYSRTVQYRPFGPHLAPKTPRRRWSSSSSTAPLLLHHDPYRPTTSAAGPPSRHSQSLQRHSSSRPHLTPSISPSQSPPIPESWSSSSAIIDIFPSTSSPSSAAVEQPDAFLTLQLRGGAGDDERRRIPAYLWFLAGGRGGPPTVERYREMRRQEREVRKLGFWGIVLSGGRVRGTRRDGQEGAGEAAAPAAAPAPAAPAAAAPAPDSAPDPAPAAAAAEGGNGGGNGGGVAAADGGPAG